MDLITQIISLVVIGAATSGLVYYTFSREQSKKVSASENDIESAIGIPVPIFPRAEEKGRVKIEPAEAKQKFKTPVNATCGHCKKVATLPFRCKFCTELFCGEHRLPENHRCEAL